MIYMLDTQICLCTIKEQPAAVLRRLKEHLQDRLCISSITLAELAHRVAKSACPQKNAAALMQFLSILAVLPFDDVAAVEYGVICADLQRKGATIGTMDMLIAGHARAQDAVLVTNDTRAFARVEDLRLENWGC